MDPLLYGFLTVLLLWCIVGALLWGLMRLPLDPDAKSWIRVLLVMACAILTLLWVFRLAGAPLALP